jgi:hypothetical protein
MGVSPLVPYRMMVKFCSAPILPPQFDIAGVAEQTVISCPAGQPVVIEASASNIVARVLHGQSPSSLLLALAEVPWMRFTETASTSGRSSVCELSHTADFFRHKNPA